MTQLADRPDEGGIFDTMKAEILESTDGHSRVRFPFQQRFTIPTGQLQGGYFGIAMDMAMAIAANGKLSTAAIQYALFRPVFEGTLTVTAEVMRSGRRILYAEAEVRDEAGRLVARGNQTAVPIDLPPT